MPTLDKNTILENEVIIDESRKSTLYKSNFWKHLTLLVEKFIHKDLTIDYIQ